MQLRWHRRFGIEKPRIALIGASEKMSPSFSDILPIMLRCGGWQKQGEFENCIMDGPLDLFLACDKKSVEIKGISTPIRR